MNVCVCKMTYNLECKGYALDSRFRIFLCCMIIRKFPLKYLPVCFHRNYSICSKHYHCHVTTSERAFVKHHCVIQSSVYCKMNVRKFGTYSN